MASRTVSILEIGETTTVPIRARAYWNDTGIAVRIGEHYRLRAEGSWRDFLITSGPDGYETPSYSLGQRLASSPATRPERALVRPYRSRSGSGAQAVRDWAGDRNGDPRGRHPQVLRKRRPRFLLEQLRRHLPFDRTAVLTPDPAKARVASAQRRPAT